MKSESGVVSCIKKKYYTTGILPTVQNYWTGIPCLKLKSPIFKTRRVGKFLLAEYNGSGEIVKMKSKTFQCNLDHYSIETLNFNVMR